MQEIMALLVNFYNTLLMEASSPPDGALTCRASIQHRPQCSCTACTAYALVSATKHNSTGTRHEMKVSSDIFFVVVEIASFLWRDTYQMCRVTKHKIGLNS